MPLPDKPSIAVLPFDNMSDDPNQEYFSDGITEDIITALSKTPKMFVIARNSSFAYKGNSIDVKNIGRDLGVKYVLEGSVRKSGGQIRINTQLIDTQTGHHLWAEKFDRNLKDIFALQDEITKKIITQLHIELTEGEQARVYSKGTDNLEAYLKVMQANWYSYIGTAESNDRARRLIEEAITLAPDYAYAYKILGTITLVDVFLGRSKSVKKSFGLSIELFNKAIARDDSLAIAYAALGYVYLMLRNFDEGIELGEKALELEPGSADVLNVHAAILTYSGRVKEAIPLFEKAFRYNPKPPNIYYRSYGHALRLSGQYEKAIALQKKAIQQAPDDLLAYIVLAQSASLAGHQQEAEAAAKQILRIDPQFSVARLKAPFKDRTVLSSNCLALNQAGLNLDCDALNKAELPVRKDQGLTDKPSNE